MTRTTAAALSSNNQVVYDVLLSYSKVKLSAEERVHLENAVSKISDYPLFVERGLASYLGPLLYKALGSINHSLPPKTASSFASAYNQVLIRNIRMYEDFKSLLIELNRKGIDCIPMKGIYLAEAVYQDLGLRHLSDIDLLVREQDTEAVCQIMQSKGWELKVAELRSEFEQEQFSPANPFTFMKNGVVIELHVRLFNLNLGLQLSEEALWNQTRNEEFCGGTIRQLTTETLVVYLCMHLHKHLRGWEAKMVSFCDIRELLIQRGTGFDWNACKQFCQESACHNEVAEVLEICQKYWWLEVPAFFFDGATIDPSIELKFRQFLTGASGQQGQVTENLINRSWRHMMSLKGIRAKISFVVGYVFPRPIFMYRHFQLKKGTFLLPWYILRVFILSRKLLIGILSRIRNSFRKN